MPKSQCRRTQRHCCQIYISNLKNIGSKNENTHHNFAFSKPVCRKLRRAAHAAERREMIRHFATHEAAFRKVYEIMSESSEGSFHYPPLSPEEVIILDSTEQSDTSHETNDEEDLPVYGLLKPDRIQLDSLLSEIGCGLVLVDRREWETADSVYVSLVMPYYSHGIVDAGTSKSFVYDPGLRSRRNIRITEHGDLNEIYRRTYNDTTLYKPVKGDWYIELDHSR